MTGRNVHLVGSVPLADAETVFTESSAILGTRLKRIPDGETGVRSSWVGWLDCVFANHPLLEPAGDIWKVHEAATPHPRYRLKPGASITDFRLDTLPYGDYARASYAVFKRLRDAGKIPAGTRFQVDFAPAHSAARSHVVDEILPAIEPIFNDAIGREIGRIAESIPTADLSFQFDAASAVFATLQRAENAAAKNAAYERFTANLAGLGNRVPTGAELMFHFCYGDNNHRHSVEPKDMGDMVEMANRLHRAIKRPIDLIHMPVPRDRDDDAYFAPLKDLDLGPETEISLGLVHLTGGIDGIKRRLATAKRHRADFSLATECGFGRRKPETVPGLLRLHAEAAALP